MKNLGAVGLILVFMMQIMSTSLILLNYEVNTDYIIENFCVNTDKPAMKCNGKCHLNKQIEADAEKKSETPAAETELMVFVLSIEQIPSFNLQYRTAVKFLGNSQYLQAPYARHLQSIFHPPQV